MELGGLYFFTATITKWKNLLSPDKYKQIIVDSLSFLVSKNNIVVYGFVIMPNHIHLIWQIKAFNGKEMPHASFMKYTSHMIQRDLKINHPQVLESFKVETESREYQFWQRDAFPVDLYSPKVIHQKLDYIHNNPCSGKWNLADSPDKYKYSSALYYESGHDDFGFLTHIGDCL